MLGIILQVFLSWVILRVVYKENLSPLGLIPTRKRVIHFFSGFLLAVTFCTAYHFLKICFIDNQWIVNDNYTFQNFITSTWFTIRGVLFEEFIFRGALLYIAYKKWGIPVACTLSAVCFGMYHWFSLGVLGNSMQMLIIFLSTGISGWVLALAFIKTKSQFLPIAMHLGWNFINIIIFSSGPIGKQLLMKENSNQAEGLLSLFIYLFQVLIFPLLSLLLIKVFDTSKNIESVQKINN